MINIDDKLISSDVVEKNFVCNLSKCKGACCWEGDFGAPLTKSEIEIIEESIDDFIQDLPDRSQRLLESKPFFNLYDKDKFEGTALHEDGSCVFLTKENGIAMCGIEKAHKEGKTPLRKPISCHLYPIRINKDPNTGIQMINYDKWDICSAACKLGDDLKIPVYEFAKEALIRHFGAEFYDQLDDIAKHLSQ
jgi:Fe-S-cluster containining protein